MMKKTGNMVMGILALVFVLGGCASSDSAPQSAAGSPARAAVQTAPATPAYYSGSGGGGTSLAILAPQGQGLAANQDYLPALVQGELVSVFSGYSAISVLDRQRLDDQYAELLSGYYDDNAEAGLDLGHLVPTDYIMGGTITRTASGYALQISVTKNADKMTAASYSGTCTFAELDNLSGIRRASAELLAKMGIALTDRAKTELSGSAAQNEINAQTALARGITAQRGDTIVEALTYYYEAANFDPSLMEAANRSSTLSTDIQSGNIGQNVRNDIQRRAAWAKTLNEAAAFFKEHPPYEVAYDPAPIQGRTNYSSGTVDIAFNAYLNSSTGLKVLYDLERGLRKAESRGWNLSVSGDVLAGTPTRFTAAAVLVNEDGKTIGTTQCAFQGSGGLGFTHDAKQLVFRAVNANDITDKLTVSITSINGMDAKTAGERGYMNIAIYPWNSSPFIISWELSRSDPPPRSVQEVWVGGPIISGYTGNSKDVVIPKGVVAIGDNAFQGAELTSVVIPQGVIYIGYAAFSGNKLTSVIIPQGVIAIGMYAFQENQLTSVVIPQSVTSIGGSAFASNQLTSVVIPQSVTSIERGAFAGNQLTSVVIPQGVTDIKLQAFSGNKLTSVVIPQSVTSIGASAFLENSYDGSILASVVMPQGLTNIGDSAFGNGYGFSRAFIRFYEGNGRKAGTYYRSRLLFGSLSDDWSFKPTSE